MKNLYIHTLNDSGNIHIKIWNDVKITRDKGLIVTKRDADFNISHGNYRYNIDLNKIKTISEGYMSSLKTVRTEYITFEEIKLTDDVKKQMREPFIEKYNNEINELKKQILELEENKHKFI